MFEKLKSFFKFDEKDMDDCIKRVEKSEEMRKQIKEKKEYGITEEEFNKIYADIETFWDVKFNGCEYSIDHKYKDNKYYPGMIYIYIDVYHNDKSKVKEMVNAARAGTKNENIYVQIELINVLKCCVEYAKTQNVKIEITPYTSRMITFYDIELLKLALDTHGVPVWEDCFYQWLPDEF